MYVPLYVDMYINTHIFNLCEHEPIQMYIYVFFE